MASFHFLRLARSRGSLVALSVVAPALLAVACSASVTATQGAPGEDAGLADASVAPAPDASSTPEAGAPSEAGDDASSDAGASDAATQPGSSCATAIDISASIGSTYAGTTHGSALDPGSCSAHASAAKAYYLIDFTATGDYDVSITPAGGYGGSSSTASLSLRTTCGDPASEIACSSTGTRDLHVGFPVPTKAYLVVDGDAFASGYTIAIAQDAPCTTTGCGVPEGGTDGGLYCDPSGACTLPITCTAPAADCDHSWADGCEVDTSSSDSNCGACGKACGTTVLGEVSHCVASQCQSSCAAGYTDCNGNPADGCECGPNGYATAGTCTAGVCTLTCTAPFGDCDGNAANGCETNTTTDDANCGACGHSCGTGTSCVQSSCATSPTTVATLGTQAQVAGLVADGSAVYWLESDGFGVCTSRLMVRPYGAAAATALVSNLCTPQELAVDADALYTYVPELPTSVTPQLLRIAKSGGAETMVAPAPAGQVLQLAVNDTLLYARTSETPTTLTALYSMPKAGGGSASQVAQDVTSFALAGGVIYVLNEESVYGIETQDGGTPFWNMASSAGAVAYLAPNVYVNAYDGLQPYSASTSALENTVPTAWVAGAHMTVSATAVYFSSNQGVGKLDVASGTLSYLASTVSSDPFGFGGGDPWIAIGTDGLYYGVAQSVNRVPL